jgi:hypothetical protein
MFETFALYVLELPVEVKAAIALAVLALLRAVLAGRVPDEWLTEVAGVLTTAIVTLIQLALGLIPPEFHFIAQAVLQLIAVLLGGILTLRVYLLAKASATVRGIRF